MGTILAAYSRKVSWSKQAPGQVQWDHGRLLRAEPHPAFRPQPRGDVFTGIVKPKASGRFGGLLHKLTWNPKGGSIS